MRALFVFAVTLALAVLVWVALDAVGWPVAG